MSQNKIIHVTDEFITQNSKHAKIKRQKKRGGPYPKNEKDARINEVSKLHFGYGYSAREISKLMNINRNTINSDVDHLYWKILKKVGITHSEFWILVSLERMNSQRTRLRERLDKVSDEPDRIGIERLIHDIDSKFLLSYLKIGESAFRVNKKSMEQVNKYMEKTGKDDRYLTPLDLMSVSKKAYQKINRIMKEDKTKHNR